MLYLHCNQCLRKCDLMNCNLIFSDDKILYNSINYAKQLGITAQRNVFKPVCNWPCQCLSYA